MTDIHQHYREQRLKEFCQRCERRDNCNYCIFKEYREDKEGMNENKTPVNI